MPTVDGFFHFFAYFKKSLFCLHPETYLCWIWDSGFFWFIFPSTSIPLYTGLYCCWWKISSLPYWSSLVHKSFYLLLLSRFSACHWLSMFSIWCLSFESICIYFFGVQRGKFKQFASWMYRLKIFITFGKVFLIISLNIFCYFFNTFFLVLWYLMVSHISLWFCLFFFILFFALFFGL